MVEIKVELEMEFWKIGEVVKEFLKERRLVVLVVVKDEILLDIVVKRILVILARIVCYR